MRDRNKRKVFLRRRSRFNAPLVSLFLICAGPALAENDFGKNVLQEKCAGCHVSGEEGVLNRIDQSRRTPEGWDMTIGRMVAAHGMRISPEERQAIVKYLSDTRGLAPSETEGWRYVLERDFAVVEEAENELVGDTCARCHSYARIALQRRSEGDWEKLSHFHVGQFSTIEIQASGRDRNWFEIASEQVPSVLGTLYPVDSSEWREWKGKSAGDLSGTWLITGHSPAHGFYSGKAKIAREKEDHYDVSLTFKYADGTEQQASGRSILYTGYEWRGTVDQGGRKVAQVFTVSEDGQQLEGRWHIAGVDSIGGSLRGLKLDDGKPRILDVYPASVQAGSEETVTIYGANLKGDISLGDGIEAVDVVSRSNEKIVLKIKASPNAELGMNDLRVGKTSLTGAIGIHNGIDYLEVLPEHALARIGGNGGARPKIPVQFEAVAFSAGQDGEPKTEDDIRIGTVEPTWKVGPGSKDAIAMDDVKYTGKLTDTGLFIPAPAGPNPERKYGTNNIGELEIIAEYQEEGENYIAKRPFIVTVQRWNDPPIR